MSNYTGNTVSLLSYANTFGDWMTKTNALAQENNNIAANNYVKATGTLFLSDPTLGLQVGNEIVTGNLQVQGIGSSAYVQNNLRVDGQAYYTNTSLSISTAGQANIGGLLLAQGSNTGLAVSNNSTFGGNIIVSKLSTLNTLNVANLATFSSNVNVQQYINSSADVNALNLNATGSLTGSSMLINGSGTLTGSLSIGGNFVLNGTTVYNTNVFTISANTSSGINSYINVNRGSSGSNASIRWNESNKYWDILDVNAGGTYSKILTANLISDSISSPVSTTVASSNALYILYNTLLGTGVYANSGLSTAQASYNFANTSNAYFYGVNAVQNTNIIIVGSYANSAYLTANAAFNAANNVTPQVQPAFNAANSAGSYANSAYAAANNVTPQITPAFNAANSAGSYANSAYALANTAPTKTGSGASGTWSINISGAAATANSVAWTNVSGRPTAVSSFTNDSGYITSSGVAYNISQFTVNQSVGTANNVQFNSMGVGTSPSGTTGEIRAIGNITGYYQSDKVFKENVQDIPNALDIVDHIGGKTFEWTQEYIDSHGGEDDYFLRKQDFGVIAQDVESVFPLAVRTKPDGTLAVDYEKLCAVAFAAIKELKQEIEQLKNK